MRSTAIGSLVLLAVACGGRVDATPSRPTAPSDTGGPVAPRPPPASADDTTDPPATGQVVDAPCPSVVPPPVDCGVLRAACPGGLLMPLAVGTFARLEGLAIDADSVYWTAAVTDLTPSCHGAIYRTPKGGGASQRVVDRRMLGGIEADASALYWAEYGPGQQTLHVLFDGGETTFATNLDPTGTGAGPTLTATARGVLVSSPRTIWRASPLALDPVADVSFYVESRPTFDGSSVFAAIVPFGATSATGTLARLGVGPAEPVTIASDATTRGRVSVVAAGGDLFYLTGDDSSSSGVLDRPMGLFRVPADGSSPPVALVPPSNAILESLTVDRGWVYFTSGTTIQRVLRAGGSAQVIAELPLPPHDLHADEQALYFRLEIATPHGEITGPANVIASWPKPPPK